MELLKQRDLVSMIYRLGLAGGRIAEAARLMERDFPGMIRMKADISGSTYSDIYGGYLAALNSLFLTVVEDGPGIFNAINQAGPKSEFYVPLFTGNNPIVGQVVEEGAGIPLISFSRDAGGLVPKKVAAGAVFTDDSLRTQSGAENAVRELSQGVILARDISLCGDLISGAGLTRAATADVLADLKALADAVNQSGFGYFFWAYSPGAANYLATLTGSGGNLVFPDATLQGGVILGIPALVSRALTDLDSLLLLDARTIVTGASGIEVKWSSAAAVEMADNPAMHSVTPASPTGKITSLFQTECSCLLGILSSAWKIMKASGVGVLTDLSAAWAIGSEVQSS